MTEGIPSIDRAHILRRDEAWVLARMSDPRASVIPVAGSDVLVTRDDPPKPLFLPLGELSERGFVPDPLILLGLREGDTFLAAGFADAGTPEDLIGRRGRWVDLRKLGFLFDSWEGDVVSLAKAMVHWTRRHLYCGDCGQPTQGSHGGFVRVCVGPSCNHQHFPRTDPAVIVRVRCGDDMLLARQPTWTSGRYSAIAGFVEPGETLEQAVIREVWEETGLRVGDVRYRFSQAWPFPGTLMVAFEAVTDARSITRDEGELEDARWLSRAQLRDALIAGSMSLPPPFAAGFWLIREWFDATGLDLRSLVEQAPAG
jgi:NAD+ diphosphatase